MAYTYGTLDDLLETYGLLKEKEVTPYWCVHHGITASMYYKDPDGNQMEFQVDCFESGGSWGFGNVYFVPYADNQQL